MKIITLGLIIASIVVGSIVFYLYRHETVTAGKYQVTYYKGSYDTGKKSLPQDLGSLQKIPGLVRITWLEQTGSELYQEYCYLPGKGTEKGRVIHKK